VVNASLVFGWFTEVPGSPAARQQVGAVRPKLVSTLDDRADDCLCLAKAKRQHEVLLT
jgi:hypothetical protein